MAWLFASFLDTVQCMHEAAYPKHWLWRSFAFMFCLSSPSGAVWSSPLEMGVVWPLRGGHSGGFWVEALCSCGESCPACGEPCPAIRQWSSLSPFRRLSSSELSSVSEPESSSCKTSLCLYSTVQLLWDTRLLLHPSLSPKTHSLSPPHNPHHNVCLFPVFVHGWVWISVWNASHVSYMQLYLFSRSISICNLVFDRIQIMQEITLSLLCLCVSDSLYFVTCHIHAHHNLSFICLVLISVWDACHAP